MASQSGGVTVDPPAGSRTTVAVARGLGRCAGEIELDAHYVAVVRERLADGPFRQEPGLSGG